jgi:uncharacterized membrane protein YeaQ/YmgE (transglycosylase-associated protein family)
MGIVAFIIIGLIAGLIARAVVPGRQGMGLIPTALLGMVGSLVGGILSSMLNRGARPFDLHPAGLLLSVLGASVLLFFVTRANSHRRHA